MASHDHPPHASCLLSMMMSDGSRLSFSNHSLFSFPDPSLIWVVDQFNQTHSPDLTDSSPLQCLYSFVMSIQWICVFLPWRRFGSGAFPCHRWFFRLSTGACPLTQGYGGFTWVFDPGINRVLADDEDIIKLVETKKNSHAQWITSGDPVSLFGFVEDENYDSDLSVSIQKTEESSKLVRMITREAIQTTSRLLLGLRLDEFLALMEFTQVCLVVIIICCTTIPMARSPFDVFVKDATSPLVMLSSTGSDYIDRDNIDCMMDFWLYQFGFCWFELSTLHVGLVNFWRQGFVDIAQIGRLENVFTTLRWVLIDMRGLGIGDDMVNILCCHVEEDYTGAIFQRDFGTEVLVPLCLHFRISFGYIGFNVTFCKKKSQPKVAVHNS